MDNNKLYLFINSKLSLFIMRIKLNWKWLKIGKSFEKQKLLYIITKLNKIKILKSIY